MEPGKDSEDEIAHRKSRLELLRKTLYPAERKRDWAHGIMAFSLKYLTTHYNMPEIFIEITPDIQLNRIFINIKLKLMQGSNRFLTWQLISEKTFHLL